MSLSNVGLPSSLTTPFAILGDKTPGASAYLQLATGEQPGAAAGA